MGYTKHMRPHIQPFGNKTLTAYKWASPVLLLHHSLLNDAAFIRQCHDECAAGPFVVHYFAPWFAGATTQAIVGNLAMAVNVMAVYLPPGCELNPTFAIDDIAVLHACLSQPGIRRVVWPVLAVQYGFFKEQRQLNPNDSLLLKRSLNQQTSADLFFERWSSGPWAPKPLSNACHNHTSQVVCAHTNAQALSAYNTLHNNGDTGILFCPASVPISSADAIQVVRCNGDIHLHAVMKAFCMPGFKNTALCFYGTWSDALYGEMASRSAALVVPQCPSLLHQCMMAIFNQYQQIMGFPDAFLNVICMAGFKVAEQDVDTTSVDALAQSLAMLKLDATCMSPTTKPTHAVKHALAIFSMLCSSDECQMIISKFISEHLTIDDYQSIPPLDALAQDVAITNANALTGCSAILKHLLDVQCIRQKLNGLNYEQIRFG
jgi:hypothetical protein